MQDEVGKGSDVDESRDLEVGAVLELEDEEGGEVLEGALLDNVESAAEAVKLGIMMRRGKPARFLWRDG